MRGKLGEHKKDLIRMARMVEEFKKDIMVESLDDTFEIENGHEGMYDIVGLNGEIFEVECSGIIVIKD